MEPLAVAEQAQAAPVSEAALIRASQQQDHDAFEQLVRLYERSVLRLAMSLLRSPEDARDAYQEAFLKVYRNLDRFRFDCNFHTWLYRIVTNVCLDALRRKRVRKEHLVDEERKPELLSPLQRAPDGRGDADPERLAAAKQFSLRLEEALEALSPNERLVFELKHYEGLKLRVIGEMLEISEEAAKNCLFRGTRKLRSALQDLT